MTPLRSVISATTPGTSLRSTALRRLASIAAVPVEFCALAVPANVATTTPVAKTIPIFRFMVALPIAWPGCRLGADGNKGRGPHRPIALVRFAFAFYFLPQQPAELGHVSLKDNWVRAVLVLRPAPAPRPVTGKHTRS